MWETRSLSVVSQLSRWYDEEKSSCSSFHCSLVQLNVLKSECTKHVPLRGSFFWFSSLLPGHLLSRLLCLIFHLLFSLNFLSPSSLFFWPSVSHETFVYFHSSLQILSSSVFSIPPPPPVLFFFPLHYFYTTSHLFFCPHSSILSFVQLCLLTCLSPPEGRLSICHRRLHGGRAKQVQEVRAYVNTSLRSKRERACLLGTGMPVSLSRENAPFWAILVCLIRCWEVTERRCKGRGEEICVHEAQLCSLNWIW